MFPNTCTIKTFANEASNKSPNTKLKPSEPQLMTAVTPSEMIDTILLPIGIFTSKIAMTNCAITPLSTFFH